LRSVVVLLALLAGCASLPKAPAHHVGPVTGIGCGAYQLGEGWQIYSCSQAGILRRDFDNRTRHVGDAGLRAFDIAVQDTPFTGLRVLVGGGRPARSGEVALLDDSGKIVSQKQVARDLVYAVAIHGEFAAAGCADGKVLLLKLPGLEILRELHAHTAPCRDVAFSNDGNRVASGGRDGLVIVSQVNGDETTVLQDHTAGVECVAFSNDGLLASGALDGKVRIHEGKTLRRTYQKLGGEVLSLAYVGEQPERLFAGLANGKLVRLDPDSAQHTVSRDFKAPVFAMAALGNSLVLGLDGEVRVVDQ
jgi:WD domain, G-beta repeat